MTTRRRRLGTITLLLFNLIFAVVVVEIVLAVFVTAPAAAAVMPRNVRLLFQQVYRHFKRSIIQFEPACTQYDPELTYILKPGRCTFANVEFSTELHVNRAGLRDDKHVEVLQYRLEHEYGARIALDRLPFSHARWVVGPNFDPKSFDWEGNRQTVQDRDGLPLVLFRDDWALQHAEEKHPELKFLSVAPMLRQVSAVATGT